MVTDAKKIEIFQFVRYSSVGNTAKVSTLVAIAVHRGIDFLTGCVVCYDMIMLALSDTAANLTFFCGQSSTYQFVSIHYAGRTLTVIVDKYDKCIVSLLLLFSVSQY